MGAPAGCMTPTPEAGTELGGTDMGAALTAVSVGLMNSPGLEIGVEAVVLKCIVNAAELGRSHQYPVPRSIGDRSRVVTLGPNP